MLCGQTKTTCWTNYQSDFASADDLSILAKYDDLISKLHMNKPTNTFDFIKKGMRTYFFSVFSATFEDEASAKNALYNKKMGG